VFSWWFSFILSDSWIFFPQDFLLTLGNCFPLVFETTPDLLPVRVRVQRSPSPSSAPLLLLLPLASASADALALALVSVSVLELCFRGDFR
jgi:hypothetical protein